MPNEPPDPSADALRLRAEQRLAQKAQASPPGDDDAHRTLHEVQVYQIELQLQNEALRDSEAAAREALRSLEQLHQDMEDRIADRTAKLTATRDALELEVLQRQAVEEELRSERAALERRVLERTQELERATAEARAATLRAEQASLQKNHFLAKVSHELRTPLQSMLGWSQVLQRSGHTPELAARAAERIIDNVGVQARLIDDLLDISRILSGNLRLDLQQVGAIEVIERATSFVRRAAEQKGVTIDIVSHIDPEATMWTDATRLEQVIWNLLSNAIHASTHGGRVQLSADVDGTALQLSVKDWGAGIDAGDLDHIFEPFHQGARTGGRHGGLGLGLTIVRHIVTLFSGDISVQSAGPGGGAEFVVRLPVDRGHGPNLADGEALTGPEQQARLRGLKVVYVEDDPDIAESCALMLRALGVEVETCVTFEQARRLVHRGGFDILLTDMRLDAGHTGTDLLQVLRQTPHGREVPALVLSAYGSEVDRQASLDAGFARHLVKPLDARNVSKALLTVLEATRRDGR